MYVCIYVYIYIYIHGLYEVSPQGLRAPPLHAAQHSITIAMISNCITTSSIMCMYMYMYIYIYIERERDR